MKVSVCSLIVAPQTNVHLIDQIKSDDILNEPIRASPGHCYKIGAEKKHIVAPHLEG